MGHKKAFYKVTQLAYIIGDPIEMNKEILKFNLGLWTVQSTNEYYNSH